MEKKFNTHHTRFRSRDVERFIVATESGKTKKAFRGFKPKKCKSQKNRKQGPTQWGKVRGKGSKTELKHQGKRGHKRSGKRHLGF